MDSINMDNITTEGQAIQFLKDNNEMRIDMDGNAWCVYGKDFTNIMESNCGFGDTVLEALTEYVKDCENRVFIKENS